MTCLILKSIAYYKKLLKMQETFGTAPSYFYCNCNNWS